MLKGVIGRLRMFFTKYPDSTARTACMVCHLDHMKYGATARKVKCLVRKNLPFETRRRILIAHTIQ